MAALRCDQEVCAVLCTQNAQLRHAAPQGFLAGVAKHGLPGGIELQVHPIAAPRDTHGVGQQLEDARKALFRLAQALLGTHVLVDVLHDPADALDATVLHHGLAPGAAPDQRAVGPLDLHIHAPGRVVPQAVGNASAHFVTPARRHAGVDVVLGQLGATGQAMDVVANVRPEHQALAALVHPVAQLRHAPGLIERGVLGQQFITDAQFLAGVVEDEHHAVFITNAHRLGRHLAGDEFAIALCVQRKVQHLAFALQRGHQLAAFLVGGPDAEFGGRTPQDLLARHAQQLAKRWVDLQVHAVGHAGNARRVRQRIVDGSEMFRAGCGWRSAVLHARGLRRQRSRTGRKRRGGHAPEFRAVPPLVQPWSASG